MSETDINDKYLRALATIENTRKGMSAELSRARKSGEVKVMLEILPVVDDLNRAMEFMNKKRMKKRDIVEGINLIFSKFDSALKRLSVSEIPCRDRKFSCNTMDAIALVPTDNVLPGIVVNEIEKGYTMNGVLIRSAKVSVSTKTGKT